MFSQHQIPLQPRAVFSGLSHWAQRLQGTSPLSPLKADTVQFGQQQRPSHLYHLTTKENYEKIIISGYMQPRPEYDEQGNIKVEGIFTFDRKNFEQHWPVDQATMENYLTRHNQHLFPSWVHHLLDRILGKIDRSDNPKQPMVLLKIKLDSNDQYWLRNPDSEHLEPEDYETRFGQGRLLEYIIKHPIPANRIEDIRLYDKSALPERSKLSKNTPEKPDVQTLMKVLFHWQETQVDPPTQEAEAA